jgi:hypothetical protein
MTIPRLIMVRITAASLGRPPKLGKKIKDRIERYGEHDAPDQDRHERADQNERPVDQESEQSEPDHKLDHVVSGQILAKGFQRRAFWERRCCCKATCRSRAIVLIHIKRMHADPGPHRRTPIEVASLFVCT